MSGKTLYIKVQLPLPKGYQQRMPHIHAAQAWCNKEFIHISKENGCWNNRGTSFWFKNPEDAAYFKLTWG